MESFVQKLAYATGNHDLPAYGDLIFSISPSDWAVSPNSKRIKNFTVQGGIKGSTLTILDENSYFCVSLSDPTPVNTTKEDSRVMNVAANAYIQRVSVYFESNEQSLMKVTNKYTFEGLGMEVNYSASSQTVFCNISEGDVEYLPSWICFTKASSPYNIAKIPSKQICSGYNFAEGDVTDIQFGRFESTQRDDLVLQHLTGTINKQIKYGRAMTLEGTYNMDFETMYAATCTRLELKSPNITGDIKKLNPNASQVQFGISAASKCNITLSASFTSSHNFIRLRIYSDGFNKSSLENFAASAMTFSGLSDNLEIYSDNIDMDEVIADTTLYNALKSIANALPSSRTFIINGTTIPRT